jgi:hypothetical protein
MYLVIKGKLNLSNYFAIMVLSTIVLVGVVVATAFLPFDKLGTALLMALLSMVSLGSSMYVMKELLKPTE